jgi:hypothetical protein
MAPCHLPATSPGELTLVPYVLQGPKARLPGLLLYEQLVESRPPRTGNKTASALSLVKARLLVPDTWVRRHADQLRARTLTGY